MAFSVNTFQFISVGQRSMFETAFNAITQLELWDFIRNFQDSSFTFSNKSEVERIYKKIEDLGYGGHSGASFGYILRNMQYISKYGIESFKNNYSNTSSNTMTCAVQQ